jgi:hypothetical protein
VIGQTINMRSLMLPGTKLSSSCRLIAVFATVCRANFTKALYQHNLDRARQHRAAKNVSPAAAGFAMLNAYG